MGRTKDYMIDMIEQASKQVEGSDNVAEYIEQVVKRVIENDQHEVFIDVSNTREMVKSTLGLE